MFELTEKQRAALGANATVREIQQQPRLWQETYKLYEENKSRVEAFLRQLGSFPRVRVIFTGAGTSAYVGDTLLPYLRNKTSGNSMSFESISTTEIVSSPYQVFKKQTPTLLVSFARSGNSPESLAAVALGKQLVDDFYQLNITCAPDGNLAKETYEDGKSLLLLPPAESNDESFAMTSSFTCMMLYALLIFDDKREDEKKNYVGEIVKMGNEVLRKEEELQKFAHADFNRIAYLGSGSLTALTREAQLKILELTAGKIATIFDSSMGFRHGPKSFVTKQTAVFVFVSNHPYTRQYDVDVLEEIKRDGITDLVVSIGTDQQPDYSGKTFKFQSGQKLDDMYLTFPFIMVAQTIAVLTSMKIGNTPDTPSPTGTVNRVVQGVLIHPFR